MSSLDVHQVIQVNLRYGKLTTVTEVNLCAKLDQVNTDKLTCAIRCHHYRPVRLFL
jgi:hypothetical protein